MVASSPFSSWIYIEGWPTYPGVFFVWDFTRELNIDCVICPFFIQVILARFFSPHRPFHKKKKFLMQEAPPYRTQTPRTAQPATRHFFKACSDRCRRGNTLYHMVRTCWYCCCCTLYFVFCILHCAVLLYTADTAVRQPATIKYISSVSYTHLTLPTILLV